VNPTLLAQLLLQLLLQPACPPGDPLAGVVRPERLSVRNPCLTVTGRVDNLFRAPDGDIHLSIRLDPAFANLVNAGNVLFWAGDLVAEIVPADQGRVALPRTGDRVAVTGTYVLDIPNGWMEIHPVRQIRVLA
jgi:hypothetical protein